MGPAAAPPAFLMLGGASKTNSLLPFLPQQHQMSIALTKKTTSTGNEHARLRWLGHLNLPNTLPVRVSVAPYRPKGFAPEHGCMKVEPRCRSPLTAWEIRLLLPE